MKSKRDARLKRARKSRSKIRELLVPRLCVYRSPRHTYAQIISEDQVQALRDLGLNVYWQANPTTYDELWENLRDNAPTLVTSRASSGKREKSSRPTT